MDVVFGGCFDFGVGIGWFWEEFEVLGELFSDCGDRVFDYINVMKVFWYDDVVEYYGKYYDLLLCS